MSPPVWVAWIEIAANTPIADYPDVATRMGGVD